MNNIKTLEGDYLAADARFAVVASRFNEFIVDRLIKGAVDILRRHGVTEKNIHLVRVPGAYELPVAARQLADTGRYEAIIALGVIIRGGTSHFEYIANACAQGLATVAVESKLPVAFGVLTVDTIEQAVERAGAKVGNKGAEAAMSALEMVSLARRIVGRGDDSQ